MKAETQAKNKAFTLIECLVCISVISILAAMLLPALNRAKQKAQGVACMNAQRQLFLGWAGWSDDNSGKVLFCEAQWDNTRPATAPETWVLSDWTADGGWIWFTTNSPMWPYTPAKDSWKCPANRTSPDLSQSMNFYCGGSNHDWYAPGFIFHKMCQFIEPSRFFVFADGRDEKDYISSMSRFSVDPPAWNTYNGLPVTAHAGSASFVFADGHAQNHRWLAPVRYDTIGGPDIAWLQEHATRF